MTGAIYAVPAKGAATELAASTLPSRIGADIRALHVGERHGIEAHPKAAACLLSHLSGRVGTLVVEQIRQDQQSIVDAHRTRWPESVGPLGSALTWWKSGWPAWRVYEPLFSMAWITRTDVRGGDIATATAPLVETDVARQFSSHADPKVFAPAVSNWAAAMRKAHCDLIDDAKARSLALAQMHRDMAMASAVKAALTFDGLVMFYGGRAHGRRDRSVPSLMGADMQARQVSIALMEDGQPQSRRATAEGLRGQYDYVWFIGQKPAAPDSCERLASLAGRSPNKK